MIDKNENDLERLVQDFVTKMQEHVAKLETCGRDGLEALNQSAKNAYDTIILQLDQVKRTLTTDDQKNAWQKLISSIQNLWNSFLELIGFRKRGEDLTPEAKADWNAEITRVADAFIDYQDKQDVVLSMLDAGQGAPAASREAVAVPTTEVAASSEKFKELTKADIASKHKGKLVFTKSNLEDMQKYRKKRPETMITRNNPDSRVYGQGPDGQIYYASRRAFSGRPSVNKSNQEADVKRPYRGGPKR